MARYENVDELTYPHKLPPSLKEMFAVKLWHIDKEYSEKVHALQSRPDSRFGSVQVRLEDLSEEDRALVLEYKQVEKVYSDLHKRFCAKFAYTTGEGVEVTGVWKRLTEAEIAAVKEQTDRTYNELRAARD